MNSYIEQLQKNTKDRQKKFYEDLDSEKNRFKDNRIWAPTIGPDGNASAIIRFLPPIQSENDPHVKYWDHYFEGPGGIYFERSLRTFGKKDPAQIMVSKLWATETPENIALARQRGARLHIVSNILVIEDKQVPDNNGKVFLYRYGKKVWEKVEAAAQPTKPNAVPIDAFNLWAPSSDLSKKEILSWAEKNGNPGANFIMEVKTVGGFNNYANCIFDDPSSLAESLNISSEQEAEFLEKIMKQAYSLNEFLEDKYYKSFDELQARLNEVLSDSGGATASPKTLADKIKSKPKVNDMGDDDPPFDVDTGSFDMKDFEQLLKN